MVKHAKKAPVKSGKPITAFFSRISSASQNSSASQSASRPKLKGEASQASISITQSSPEDLPVESNVAERDEDASKPRNECLKPVSPNGSSRRLRSSTEPQGPKARTISASLKRARSPSSSVQRKPDNKKPPSQVGASQARRKSKFDSSSEVEEVESVIYVKRSPNAKRPLQHNSLTGTSQPNALISPRKKPRLSSPLSPTPSLVPSSQSDEEELATPESISQSLQKAGSNTGKQWRKQALPPTPDAVNGFISVDMDMDIDEPPPIEDVSQMTIVSELEISVQLGEPASPSDRSSTPLKQVLTPPYTDTSPDDIYLAPLPPTPIALDAATKTRKIIEQIKARAYAECCSSPEPAMEVPEELDDSSEDEGPLPVFSLAGLAKKVSEPTTSNGSTNAGTHLRRSSRQLGRPPLLGSPRDGSPVSSSSLLGGNSLSRRDGASAKHGSKPRYSKATPFDVFLKEKRRTGGLFQQAETEVSLDQGLDDMIIEDDADKDWDYDKFKNPGNISLTVDRASLAPDDVFLDEEDRKRLFGEEGGKEIYTMLESDRVTKKEVEETVNGEGIQLWGSSEHSMVVDEETPSFNYTGNSVSLQLLSNAIQQRDYHRAIFLLNSGVLATLNFVQQPQILNELCLLATYESRLSEAAFRAVLHILDSPGDSQISATFVLGTILRLGAQPSYLESAGLKTTPLGASHDIDAAKREAVLYRMVALVNRLAKAKRLISDEIPEVIIALLLVSLDPSTSPELQAEIMVAINYACHCIPSDDATNRVGECTLVSRLASLAATYEPANQALMISVLAAGTGSTQRIARFVAYCIITKFPLSSITVATYRDPPPLPLILNQLVQMKSTSDADPSAVSVFQIDDDTDYGNLKQHIRILSIALSNVKGYVEEQRRSAKGKSMTWKPPPSPSKLGEKKPETDLQLLHKLLEQLHAEINDLRAAHLDRSRTKAVVKQLQMRVYYQASAYDKAWKDQHLPKPNLKAYFSVKPSTTASSSKPRAKVSFA